VEGSYEHGIEPSGIEPPRSDSGLLIIYYRILIYVYTLLYLYVTGILLIYCFLT
jgi:hypothetical protein